MAITKRITKGSSLTYQEMDDNLEQIAPRTSSTGSIQIPAGTTAERDSSPAAGYLRYNNQLNQFEGYTTSWGALAGGGGGGGEVNQNAFSTFSVSGQTNIDADSSTDTINFAAGSNITLTTNASTDTLTIAASFSQDFAYSSLTGTPTTVSGYGITDAQPLLVSGTNIKTVNGNSLMGSGDISLTASTDWSSITNKPNTISGFGIIDAFDGAWSSLTGTPTTLSGYGITDGQTTLVSGSSIKTINGVSVLGAGDLTVTGSYGDSDVSSHLNTLSATTGQVLSWTGIDFQWIAAGGGGGSETDPVVGAITGIVKADGSGNISAAVSGTDYSTFDGDWNSLTNTPTTLTDAGIVAGLLDLTNSNSNNINDGSAGQYLQTDGNGNFSFQTVSGGGGGTTTFVGLSDTPNNYSGAQNQVVAVNAQATGLTYITINAGAESNDLSSIVTWDIVPDAYISNTSVVQHQSDLRITESQITDLQAYLLTETDPVFSAHTTANINNGSGFLAQDGAGNWFYDSNTYITSTAVETDPVFTAHTTYDIVQGTGLLGNLGTANSWYYDSNTYIQGSDVPDNETDPIFSAHTTSSINNGSGFLKQDGAGNWFYDSNTYVTSAGSETDPVFTAHTTYNIANGLGLLKNDGGGTWSYDNATYLSAELDPIFDAHTTSDIVDGEGFLRQDSANNWYWDANTYITANDIPASSLTLDDVTTNGSSTTNSIEVGAATVGGVNVMLEGSNNALLSNGASFITLEDLSATGDVTYDNTTGVFSANLVSTGIELNDLTAIDDPTPSGNGSLSYSSSNGTFVFTPPDLSGLSGGGGSETDPVFGASAVANVVAAGSSTDGFLRNYGGEWYYDANTYSTSTVANLDDLGDVSISGLADNETLLWDSGQSVFINGTIDSLIDTHLNQSNPTTGYVLSWDGADYAWIAQSGGGGGGIALTDLSASTATAGTADLSYDNTTGVFTYTPPDLSSYLTSYTDTLADVTNRGNTSTAGITVNGNLDVAGGASDGGKITLNYGQTGSPSSSSTNWSYLEVERGSLANVSIRWHEGFDRWEFTNDGSNFTELGATTIPTLDAVMGAGDETNNPLTLYRGTDGNISEGTLKFETRDTTPTLGQAIGDIQWYADTDTDPITSTLGEMARLSANKHSNNYTGGVDVGQMVFGVTVNTTLTPALKIGDTPAGGNPTSTTYATHFENLPVWMENSLRIYETVDDTADITSDANISGLKLTALDGLGNYKDRVSLSHQNNIARYRVTDRVNDDEYTELIMIPSQTSMLSINYKATGGSTSSYDVWTDYDGGQKVRDELTDENVLHKFGSYANTEYITERSDFGGFNGGSSGNADLVPSSAQIGSLAFFNWTDALNGTAGANRYIPAGHAEEVVHGMGILRDGGQHSLGSARWDPFGGPDFRVSVDNTGGSATGLGGLVYMFGGTSISNDDTPVTTIITNQNYNATDNTIISQTSYRTGQNTTTFDHEEYARVTVSAVDVTSGTEDAKIVHAVQKAGTLTDMLEVSPDGIDVDGDVTIDNRNRLRLADAGVDKALIGLNQGKYLYMGSEGTNSDPRIRFDGESTQAAIVPTLPAGATTSGASGYLNLGSTGSAFKEIHLTDGVVFGDAGGTGSATSNILNDYEEGEWTPTILGTISDPTITYNAGTGGRYTKIGNLVHYRFYIKLTSVSGGSGNINIGGLPFTNTAAGVTDEGHTVNFNFVREADSLGSGQYYSGYTRTNDNKVYVTVIGGPDTTNYLCTNLINGWTVYGSGTMTTT